MARDQPVCQLAHKIPISHLKKSSRIWPGFLADCNLSNGQHYSVASRVDERQLALWQAELEPLSKETCHGTRAVEVTVSVGVRIGQFVETGEALKV
jgi:hypothetical protein